MSRVFVYGGIFLISLICLPFSNSPEVFGLLGGLATGFAVPLVDALAQNFRYIRLAWASWRHRRDRIRVSFSYLFRIEDKGSYMLVRSQRYEHQMQPVGGVYKLSGSARQRLASWEVQKDNLIPIDDTSDGDIRLRVPGRHLMSFVRWFESGEDRETSPWREFNEELVGTGLLSTDQFPYIYHNFARRKVNKLRYSEYAQSWELLVADIYDLLPTEAQLAALRRTKGDGYSTELAWYSADQILRRGAVPGLKQEVTIAETAAWIL